ncbi:sigma-70 family RNA polymerase sigma factor [Nocardioides mesophilus]|uniref:Sigma-70 family RNA polymerase sigma factor n=1 Tax=Nocardioides mesophilus TaxID=433659 RepID=A0A7G9RD00_9ACTN|nr:sigma-70 family RNA polymerase sigma factor [Nocardioides mesophilus]QNN53475.1 sigma-70 family RNA polymerase sigma factor [Nocardioides mesophilus]
MSRTNAATWPAALEHESRTRVPVGPVTTEGAETRGQISTRLLTQAAGESDPLERKRLQDEVVVMHMGLARATAARYRGRGIAEEDLEQAAAMALLKAARNFDPTRGVEFLSYAVVTMTGEVKRQFRDFGWMVRPPRAIQRLQAEVSRAEGELTHQLGRSPKVREVAEHLGVPEDDVLEALSADGCYTPTSLDLPVGAEGNGVLGDTLSQEDGALAEAEARVMLLPAVRALPERDRTVLYLRFFKQQSQSQIAAQIDVTQMQVSRILSRVLDRLHGELSELT